MKQAAQEAANKPVSKTPTAAALAALSVAQTASGNPNYKKEEENNSGKTSSGKTSSIANRYYNYDYVETPVVSQPPVEIAPDTTVQDSYKAAMEAANDRLKQAYEYQQGLLATAKDNALREAYIKQQMVERGYPEQLSAAGINGGAAQGLIA